MEPKEQRTLELEEEQTQDPGMEQVSIDLSTVREVERQRVPLTDLKKHAMKQCRIGKVELIRVPSQFARARDGKAHRLRIVGDVVEKVDHEGRTIEIRPSELIEVEEDRRGDFRGLPKGPTSYWQRLKLACDVANAQELVGKRLPMRITKNKNGAEFLGFVF